MAIDLGVKTAGPAYVAAGLTTGAGAATALGTVTAVLGIVASVVGIVCTVVTTVAVVRSQRRRTAEQAEHHREVERIHRGDDEG